MVDKMIINTKIEITLIIIFIIISIPLWIYFKQELNSQLALAIEGETKLDLFLNNIDGFDNVIVNNAYQVNKKYRILLVTDKNCDNSYITINKREYQLDNFEKRKVDDNYIYVLTTKTIKGTRDGYKIDINLQNKNVNYYYKLEELTDF